MPKTWRFYIILIVIFMLGIFESFKAWNLNADSSPAQTVSGLDLKNFDMRPFNADSLHAQNDKQGKFRMKKRIRSGKKLKVSDVLFQREHSFDESKKKKTTKKKVKKKKKKKKVVKKKAPVEIFEPQRYPEEPEVNEQNDDDIIAEQPEEPALAPIGAPPEDPLNDIPQTYEEWAKILLPNPDYKRVTEFIGFYENQMVSPDVFYKIMTTMLEDQREEMNILAVRALGSTPSPTSFNFISEVLISQIHSPKVKALGRTQLEIYTSINHLNTLTAVVTSQTSVIASTFAAEYLQRSARRNLQPTTPQAPGGTTTDPSTQTTDQSSQNASSNAKRYTDIAESLKRILNTAEFDNGFARAASEAILTIVELTG